MSKLNEARVNFKAVGFENKITVVHTLIQNYLSSCEAQSFDMIFLDSNRAEYLNYYDSLISSLRCGGLLVCDNAISHQSELEPLVNKVKADPRLLHCTVKVGKGELLVYKR